MIRFVLLLVLSIAVAQAWSYSPNITALNYNYDVVEYFVIDRNIKSEAQNSNYDDIPNLQDYCSTPFGSDLPEKARAGSFFALGGIFVVTKGVSELTKSQLKGIKSLEKQIQRHQQKLDNFKVNPTVRPGMENLPKDLIRQQQNARIKHLETEINTFRNNIEKIRNGEL